MRPSESLVNIFTGTLVQVKMLEKQLKEIGINSMVKGNMNTGLPEGPMSPSAEQMELYVDESAVPKVEKLVEDFKSKVEEHD